MGEVQNTFFEPAFNRSIKVQLTDQRSLRATDSDHAVMRATIDVDMRWETHVHWPRSVR